MLDEILKGTKNAQKELALLSPLKRIECLKLIAKALNDNKAYIIEQNAIDIKNARLAGINESMIERLTLTDKRLDGIIDGVNQVAELPDYNNEILEKYERPNGIIIEKLRVPLGVVAVIFESRPNVSVDIAALCLKTSNACVLKGGKEAINSNKALADIMKNAIKDIVNPDCITLIESTDRAVTNELITKKEYIDVLIPRGSKGLIKYVIENAKIPYIETGAGNCHLYVEAEADFKKAIDIAINAKYQRPSVCNAIENLIVDEKIAKDFLPLLYKEFNNLGIEIRGCDKTASIITCNKATDEDFYTEYNQYIIAVKVVKDIDEAIEHINSHSTHHSEAIITENIDKANYFLERIDSACVYHNASTRFTDGGEFGFGAEIGISTQKLHARGPMGLRELFSYKYKIYGNGQVRK